jgi:hypothetical protein
MVHFLLRFGLEVACRQVPARANSIGGLFTCGGGNDRLLRYYRRRSDPGDERPDRCLLGVGVAASDVEAVAGKRDARYGHQRPARQLWSDKHVAADGDALTGDGRFDCM